MRLGPDVDGDGIPELTLSASQGACGVPGEGWVSSRSIPNGELSRWCGLGGHTAFGGGLWVGDVDGLGLDDVVVGEPFYYDPVKWGRETGRVLVYSTESQQLLYDIIGTQTDGRFGGQCEALDDVDQDGVNDLLVGAQFYGTNSDGKLLVYSMKTGSLIRSNNGGFQQSFGRQIAALGDTDGDGVGDYAGAMWQNCGGRVEVFSGRTGAKLARFDGHPGVCDNLGYSLSSGGDLDGDGLDDLLLSGADPITGKAEPQGRVEAWSIASKSLIWSIPGQPKEWFGEFLCGVGDINGDGYREILVTAGLDDHDGKDIGRVDLISGRSIASTPGFPGSSATASC